MPPLLFSTYLAFMKWLGLIVGAAGLMATFFGADIAAACSRVLWADNDQAVVVGRNVDWAEDPRSNLWAFPRGIARSGLSGDANSLAWTSKYGSLTASFYDLATLEGLNEKGLVAELQWLSEADYGKRDPKAPGLSLSLWAQYMLDNFATVAEAVAAMEKHDFQIVPIQHVPGTDAVATVHLSLSDATGDSALVEIADSGRLHIYHDRKYTVMTNSPPFPRQLANLKRYRGFGGTEPLPGTNEPADRFVRAAYYVQNLPQPKDLRETIAWTLSIMRNVAQPFTRSTDPSHPEASGTYWRSVTDSTNRVYFFESTLRPNIVWVRLDGLGLSSGEPVRKLDLINGGDLIGDVTAAFRPSEPFAFREGEF